MGPVFVETRCNLANLYWDDRAENVAQNQAREHEPGCEVLTNKDSVLYGMSLIQDLVWVSAGACVAGLGPSRQARS